MKQTAVEWLRDLYENRPAYEECILEDEWEEALKVEKEQLRTILLAYNEERNDRTDGAQNYWEPYEVDDFLEKYNETFKANEK
jgi:hypothetical protein